MASPSTPVERLLVRSVNWLGDAVMSTPALLRLREAKPTTHITLLTPAKLAELWRHHPAIDAVMSLEAGESVWRVARRLREQRFHASLVLPNSLRSALEVFLAGIPQRIGYARNGRSWLLTHRVPPRPGEIRMRKRTPAEVRRLAGNPAPALAPNIPGSAHHVFQYLHLAAALGGKAEPLPPVVAVKSEEVQNLNRHLLSIAKPAACWLAMSPGAEYGPAKRWPFERFAHTALELHRQTNCGWLILGGHGDIPVAGEIAVRLRKAGLESLANFAGRTSLRELCAALALSRALLTNDSGPMHLATALGTPVVALFGSTSPILTGPSPARTAPTQVLCRPVACAPCFLRRCPIDHRCMNALEASEAIEAVKRMMDSSGGTLP